MSILLRIIGFFGVFLYNKHLGVNTWFTFFFYNNKNLNLSLFMFCCVDVLNPSLESKKPLTEKMTSTLILKTFSSENFVLSI